MYEIMYEKRLENRVVNRDNFTLSTQAITMENCHEQAHRAICNKDLKTLARAIVFCKFNNKLSKLQLELYLLSAISESTIEIMQYVLDKLVIQHMQVNDYGYKFRDYLNQFLSCACQKNNIQAVQLLLQYRANPNYLCGEKFITPLHQAISHKNLSMVKYLLAAGANPGFAKQMESPLTQAVKLKYYSIIAEFLPHCNKDTIKESLGIALSHDFLSAVLLLQDNPMLLMEYYPTLKFFCASDHERLFKYIISLPEFIPNENDYFKFVCDIIKKTQDTLFPIALLKSVLNLELYPEGHAIFNRALVFAVYENREAAVDYLLNLGADLIYSNENGRSALTAVKDEIVELKTCFIILKHAIKLAVKTDNWKLFSEIEIALKSRISSFVITKIDIDIKHFSAQEISKFTAYLRLDPEFNLSLQLEEEKREHHLKWALSYDISDAHFLRLHKALLQILLRKNRNLIITAILLDEGEPPTYSIKQTLNEIVLRYQNEMYKVVNEETQEVRICEHAALPLTDEIVKKLEKLSYEVDEKLDVIQERKFRLTPIEKLPIEQRENISALCGELYYAMNDFGSNANLEQAIKHYTKWHTLFKWKDQGMINKTQLDDIKKRYLRR